MTTKGYCLKGSVRLFNGEAMPKTQTTTPSPNTLKYSFTKLLLMHCLNYVQLLLSLSGIALLAGVVVYFFLKTKMHLIKEESKAMRFSQKGMWDTNASWNKKYNDLKTDYEQLKLNNKPIKTMDTHTIKQLPISKPNPEKGKTAKL